MNKKDLIKYIAENLEKALPENLEYNLSNINISIAPTGIYTSKDEYIIVSRDFNVEINFVGMF